MEILNNNQTLFISNPFSGFEIKEYLEKKLGFTSLTYYLVYNGKCINNTDVIENGNVSILPRVLGGKGGFGSMLRAIGAQIEKTTNREACRDLSGRRLRDINEEQRLKNWINQQAEREKETKERKRKKLERLCEKPKHDFQDESYDKERSELPEVVESAVLQGLEASCSSKRLCPDKPTAVKKKKPKLWVDDELDDDDITSSDDEKSESEKNSTKRDAADNTDSKVSFTSSNSKNKASSSGSEIEEQENSDEQLAQETMVKQNVPLEKALV